MRAVSACVRAVSACACCEFMYVRAVSAVSGRACVRAVSARARVRACSYACAHLRARGPPKCVLSKQIFL